MGKKLLSDMTAQRFVEITGALHGYYSRMAKDLGVSPASVSAYANGRQPIPQEVVDKLRVLLDKRIAECNAIGQRIRQGQQDDAVSQLIVVTNEIRQAQPPRMPGLKRREKPEDSRVYPAYRMHPKRFQLWAQTLGEYHIACIDRRRQASDPRDIRAYDRELADLKVIAGNTSGIASKGAPYDMFITFSEWFVVSRALRHTYSDERYALYQHWRHHKGSGYPS